METPDPPNDTPGALKQVATWHPMTSHGALGIYSYFGKPLDLATYKFRVSGLISYVSCFISG